MLNDILGRRCGVHSFDSIIGKVDVCRDFACYSRGDCRIPTISGERGSIKPKTGLCCGLRCGLGSTGVVQHKVEVL